MGRTCPCLPVEESTRRILEESIRRILEMATRRMPPKISIMLLISASLASAIALPSSRWLLPNQLQENLSRSWWHHQAGNQQQKFKLSPMGNPLGIYSSPFLKRWNSGIGIPSWLRNSKPGSWGPKMKRGSSEEEAERLPACLLAYILQLAADEWCNNSEGGGVRCSAATQGLRELPQQELIRCGQYLTPQALIRPGVRIH